MTDPFEQVDWRTERARLVGWLARRFGDLDLAEESTQEAFEAAAAQWAAAPPDRPGAWLHTVAYRRAIATLRRRRIDTTPLHTSAEGDDDPSAEGGSPGSALGDDLFGLLCACCHPALPTEHQIALTLRHVCGLGVEQIAAAFLVADQTMAKRLVRAREKIRLAGIPFRVPARDQLDARIDGIRTVIYLTFNEGYLSSTPGDPIVRPELCDEAVWLARHLVQLHPDAESLGLLALLIIQDARRGARTDDHGELVEFARQDRTHWDLTALDEGRRLLGDAHDGTVGRYRIEALIALLHVTGPEPDWPRIADLYGVLARTAPSPVVDVNGAYAIGMADGAQAGLMALERLQDAPGITAYAPFHAARADLLERVGSAHKAADAWASAAVCARHPAERAAIDRRLGALLGGDGGTQP